MICWEWSQRRSVEYRLVKSSRFLAGDRNQDYIGIEARRAHAISSLIQDWLVWPSESEAKRSAGTRTPARLVSIFENELVSVAASMKIESNALSP